MKPRILYISYDGMLEPLGQSQVLAYLEQLAGDCDIRLMSFEKKADWRDRARRDALRARLRNAGIAWLPLRYHKAPSAPATAWDIAVGSAVASWQILRHRIRVVHARSYVPGVMALAAKRLTGARFLFDMRGFWADERIDGGLWPREGRLYRAAKGIERRLLAGADHIVTLTEASVAEIDHLPGKSPATPVTIITTCANLDRFRPPAERATRPFVLGYVGSVGTWYLFDEALTCFEKLRAREPDARLLIVNRNEQAFIRERLAARGIDPAAVELLSAEHGEVPALVGRMTAGLAIIKPVFSKIASAPTKLAEYLACGVPCLGNRRVGDVEAILEGERIGIAIGDLSDAGLEAAVDRLIPLAREAGVAARCRAAAERYFSLAAGVAAYAGIYRRLSGGPE
ncbi:MAG TPA: glycosyltransferase [Allosphingosinicella sp.]|nr:glycosyltransferase [Allosphingosinicella sp.]